MTKSGWPRWDAVKTWCVSPEFMHDVGRSAGRTGMGAVMGSKNLKAIAVRGTKVLDVADRKQIVEVSKWLAANYEEKAGWAAEMGTPGGLVYLGTSTGGAADTSLPGSPVRDPEHIGGEWMHKTILKERDTCMACPITCKQVVEVQGGGGRYSIDPVYGGPEYETLGAALGSNCFVSDLLAVAKANERCAAYGLNYLRRRYNRLCDGVRSARSAESRRYRRILAQMGRPQSGATRG